MIFDLNPKTSPVFRDDFFQLLTDFSYFRLQKIEKVAGHDLNMSKMEILKEV
jgi:hypothetical protein